MVCDMRGIWSNQVVENFRAVRGQHNKVAGAILRGSQDLPTDGALLERCSADWSDRRDEELHQLIRLNLKT